MRPRPKTAARTSFFEKHKGKYKVKFLNIYLARYILAGC